jgi:hypothetical protein
MLARSATAKRLGVDAREHGAILAQAGRITPSRNRVACL